MPHQKFLVENKRASVNKANTVFIIIQTLLYVAKTLLFDKYLCFIFTFWNLEYSHHLPFFMSYLESVLPSAK